MISIVTVVVTKRLHASLYRIHADVTRPWRPKVDLAVEVDGLCIGRQMRQGDEHHIFLLTRLAALVVAWATQHQSRRQFSQQRLDDLEYDALMASGCPHDGRLFRRGGKGHGLRWQLLQRSPNKDMRSIVERLAQRRALPSIGGRRQQQVEPDDVESTRTVQSDGLFAASCIPARNTSGQRTSRGCAGSPQAAAMASAMASTGSMPVACRWRWQPDQVRR